MNFQLAGGSVPGSAHVQQGNLLIGRNNQDAYEYRVGKELIVAASSDGCGSQPKSELGSNLVVPLLLRSLDSQYRRFLPRVSGAGFEQTLPLILEATRQDIIAHLRILAQAMTGTGSFSSVVNQHFLCTLLGTLITPHGAGFFSIGDGLFVINGEINTIGPFAGNEPPYLAYALYESRWTDPELRFAVHRTLPTADLHSFLLGTDGCGELLSSAQCTIPGAEELIGPLERLWSEPQFFSKTGLQRWLRRINSTHYKLAGARNQLIVDDPRLKDDTTLIVGRRMNS